MALPGTGKSFDQFRADDANCRQYAFQQSGGVSAVERRPRARSAARPSAPRWVRRPARRSTAARVRPSARARAARGQRGRRRCGARLGLRHPAPLRLRLPAMHVRDRQPRAGAGRDERRWWRWQVWRWRIWRRTARSAADAGGHSAAAAALTAARASSYGMARTCVRWAVRASTVDAHALHVAYTLSLVSAGPGASVPVRVYPGLSDDRFTQRYRDTSEPGHAGRDDCRRNRRRRMG